MLSKQLLKKIFTDDFIKKLCKGHKVTYHHHDFYCDKKNYGHETDNAAIVIYPAPYAPWCMAISHSGKIFFPGDELKKKIERTERLVLRAMLGWCKEEENAS